MIHLGVLQKPWQEKDFYNYRYVTRIQTLMTQTCVLTSIFFLELNYSIEFPLCRITLYGSGKHPYFLPQNARMNCSFFFVKKNLTNKMEIADIWPLNISQSFNTHTCLQQCLTRGNKWNQFNSLFWAREKLFKVILGRSSNYSCQLLSRSRLMWALWCVRALLCSRRFTTGNSECL